MSLDEIRQKEYLARLSSHRRGKYRSKFSVDMLLTCTRRPIEAIMLLMPTTISGSKSADFSFATLMVKLK
jgi:hypothetical protein